MLASRIFVVPITSVSPSTMRGMPEICICGMRDGSDKCQQETGRELHDALG